VLHTCGSLQLVGRRLMTFPYSTTSTVEPAISPAYQETGAYPLSVQPRIFIRRIRLMKRFDSGNLNCITGIESNNHRAISHQRCYIHAMPLILFLGWLYIAAYATIGLAIILWRVMSWPFRSPTPMQLHQPAPAMRARVRREPVLAVPPPTMLPLRVEPMLPQPPPQAPPEPPGLCRVPLTPTERQRRVRAVQAALQA
jgi:hypothetical protein